MQKNAQRAQICRKTHPKTQNADFCPKKRKKKVFENKTQFSAVLSKMLKTRRNKTEFQINPHNSKLFRQKVFNIINFSYVEN